MSAGDLLRVAGGLVWFGLLIYLWKPARAAMAGTSQARSSELVMSAVWLLCLNRLTFTLVSLLAPGDQDALAFCHVFALAGGCYMFFMCSLARRRG